MKKIVLLLMAFAMALALVACGTNTGSAPTDSAAPAENTAAPEQTASAENTPANAADIKVALLLPGNINDAGFNAAAYNGLQEAIKTLGIQGDYTEAVPVAEMEAAIRDYAARGYNLILCHGNDFNDAVTAVAPEFPEVSFAISSSSLRLDNAIGMDVKSEEQGYMAGYALGLITKANKVGYVSSIEGLSMKRTQFGFEQGVKAANPNAEIIVSYIGSMDDAAKGKETTVAVFESGADGVFQYAQGAGVGVIQAAAEAGKFVVVTTPKQAEMAPDTYVMSCQVDMKANILTAIQAYVNGTFGPSLEIVGNTSTGAFIFGTYNEKVLTADQIAKLEDQVAKIKSGEVQVKLLAES
ncbi:MAG: BMP family protein [Bacillota bacterium]